MRGLKPLDGVVSVRVLVFEGLDGVLKIWVVDNFLFRGRVLQVLLVDVLFVEKVIYCWCVDGYLVSVFLSHE